MECQICPRPPLPNSLLCRFHKAALKRLIARFEVWQRALEVDWAGYLKRVDKNAATGVWVREIAAWSSATHKSEKELRRMLKRPTPALQDP